MLCFKKVFGWFLTKFRLIFEAMMLVRVFVCLFDLYVY